MLLLALSFVLGVLARPFVIRIKDRILDFKFINE
jgi:hypothetical protein